MNQEITINDLIELEAYAEAFRKKAEEVRRKMEHGEKKVKRAPSKKAQTSAATDAFIERILLRSKAKYEAKKRQEGQ